MRKQSLRDREIALALEELHGKQSIGSICRHLKSKGLIVVPEDAIAQYEREQTRKAIQRARKYRDGDDHPVEMVSLFEFDDATKEKNSYYKHIKEVTVKEGHQLCQYWHSKGRYADKELLRYVKLLNAIHGKTFQQNLPFKLPKLPKETV